MGKTKIINNYIYNTLYQVLLLISPLIITPYISRVLGVVNIGTYDYTQSIATYFVLIGAVGTALYGRREIAYLQSSPEQRTKAFWEIELFRIVSVFLFSILYYIAFCNNGSNAILFRILTIEIIATAFDISWFFMGMEDFKLVVIRNSIIKIIGILCVFAFVKTEKDLFIYALCMTVPIFIGNMSLWFTIRRYTVDVELYKNELICGIKKRLKPILILFLPQIAVDVYTVLDKTMIGLLAADISQVGYYSQAQKVIKVVLALVTSIGTVMLPAMSAKFAKGEYDDIKNAIERVFKFVFMLSFALLFGICGVVSEFVPVFFGKGYEPVISLMIIISPIIVIIATSDVIGKQFLLPTNQQYYYTSSIIIGAVVNFILNILLIPSWNAIGASVATVVAELSVTFTQCVFVRKQLPLRDCFSGSLRYLCYGFVMFLVVRAVGKAFIAKQIIKLIVMIATGVLVYFIELIITKDETVYMGLSVLKKDN